MGTLGVFPLGNPGEPWNYFLLKIGSPALKGAAMLNSEQNPGRTEEAVEGNYTEVLSV